MKKLELLGSPSNDEVIAGIASCIDKIEELWFDARDVKIDGWKILSTAINNRQIPVS